MMAQTPMRSSDFINTLGVNTHILYTDGEYADIANIAADLQYLGISNVRDMLVSWVPMSNYINLAQHGIKFTFLLVGGGSVTTADLQSQLALVTQLATAVPGSVIAVEGPNEINNWPVTYNGVTGLQGALNLQHDIYAAVQASPVLKGIAVDYFTGYDAGSVGVGPNPQTTTGLATFDNQHPYPNSGQAPYQWVNRTQALPNENPATGPAVYTETGYSTNGGTGGAVNADVQAKYTLDLLMDDARSGIAQTYLYELMDAYQPGSPQGDGGFGLFDPNKQPKLAATAIHDLTTVLADSGGSATSFTPKSVNYSTANLPTTGNSLVLQKSNGNTDIVVWNEPQIWDAATGTERPAATTNVTVNLGGTYQAVAVFDPLIGTTAIRTLSNVSSVTLGLTDHPLIVELGPQTGPTTTPTPAPVPTPTPEPVPVPVPVQALSITAVSVASAPLGAPITISGTGFGTTPGTVVIGGVRMSVTSWSDTKIATSIPNFTGLVPGDYNFDVTTASGSSVVSGAPYFAIVAGAPKTMLDTTAAPLQAPMTAALDAQTASITVTPSKGHATTVIADRAGSFNIAGDTFDLPAIRVANVGVGSDAGTIQFIHLGQINLTEGTAHTVVTADAGTNTWTAGIGTLEVNGGGGRDTYVYHQGNGRMTVDDFSAAKGDMLTISSPLQASMTMAADGTGGTLLSFASGGGIDLKGITTNVAGIIHWS